jgi:hypothetical protein
MNTNLEQEVRLRAYELWVLNGKIDGQESDHWYAAESEVRAGHVEARPVATAKPKAKRAKAKAKAA